MSFDAVNQAIAAQSGGWAKLQKVGDKIAGVLVDVELRNKSFNGKIQLDKNENPRKEWVLTLDTEDGTKKVALAESGQFSVRNALAGRPLEKGGYLELVVTEASVRGEKQAQMDAKYKAPTTNLLPDDEELPF